MNDDDVIDFPATKTLDLPPNKVLEGAIDADLKRAIDADLKEVLVLGYYDGGLYISSSNSDLMNNLALLELCKEEIMIMIRAEAAAQF